MILFTIYFYIIKWNCRGLRDNSTDIILLCDKYNPIVCCQQETMLTKDDYVIRGFNCIHLIGSDIGGGACQSWLETTSLAVSANSTQLFKRNKSPYLRLKLLLFVHYICLQVKI